MNKLKIILRIIFVALIISIFVIGIIAWINNPNGTVHNPNIFLDILYGVCEIIVLCTVFFSILFAIICLTGLFSDLLIRGWKWLWNIKDDNFL